MKIKLEKVYKVTYMLYTNAMRDTVSDWDGKGHSLADCEYLDVGKEPFLLRESQLEQYRKFGGGYRNIEFVGQIPIPYGEDKSCDKVDYQYVDVASRIQYDPSSDINYSGEGPVGSDSTATVPPPPGVIITCTNNGET